MFFVYGCDFSIFNCAAVTKNSNRSLTHTYISEIGITLSHMSHMSQKNNSPFLSLPSMLRKHTRLVIFSGLLYNDFFFSEFSFSTKKRGKKKQKSKNETFFFFFFFFFDPKDATKSKERKGKAGPPGAAARRPGQRRAARDGDVAQRRPAGTPGARGRAGAGGTGGGTRTAALLLCSLYKYFFLLFFFLFFFFVSCRLASSWSPLSFYFSTLAVFFLSFFLSRGVCCMWCGVVGNLVHGGWGVDCGGLLGGQFGVWFLRYTFFWFGVGSPKRGSR
jgi:hypothetical protein